MAQKKRVVITLDPEYIPWEADENIVKLRHPRPKWLRWTLRVAPFVALIVMGLVAWLVPHITLTAAPPSAAVSPLATPINSPATTPGQLTLVRRDGLETLYCTRYTIFAGAEILGRGSTARGALLDISAYRQIEVVCDGKTITF